MLYRSVKWFNLNEDKYEFDYQLILIRLLFIKFWIDWPSIHMARMKINNETKDLLKYTICNYLIWYFYFQNNNK